MTASGNAVSLRARLLVAVGAPLVLAGCWSVDQTQETYLLYVEPGMPCPPKEDVPLGETDGDRCHPGIIISVDEGPLARDHEAYDGKKVVRCEYLVTREKTFTPGNSVCLGSGRPLWADGLRIASLLRRALAEGAW